jgi:hypothetical protein
MVPSLLLAAVLAQQADTPSPTANEVSVPPYPHLMRSGPTVPVKHPVLVWGDPSHLRGYPWEGLHPVGYEPRLTMPVKSSARQKLVTRLTK